ncbi:MAG: undecaprenyldiphospho-muramoylpentapeptide beta-N-acetylglucosaminyltransferase [Bacteroidales bacterium]|jgi:UDP-N-acetylglucosamine--N-acetylmuramyl-(pentapeptide) pyrophosphoryl-undecaprenol N-acetylglucosamine transferase|nr:undecaprenyldiphospho-muramoylpentapeptide beta-N-acetylglucosaminyltransferase [Bacteroidales bacterium]HOA10132.1 undecaprenyldiphospho-muramoylpentapeptide beta-N-acetylglucosaminyltransferase [Tenuifilaceae bacterium]HOC37146.1 undecaprenyldiphospho-muramoylpentapeptide beta-N-acetylglucosaminyltransferase [Tenuifilaceae bacterium]HOG72838.1 undecaprenyldiphospho-muramoylpentapeptide beta-N-acetylglucosaminyltransferase [Tenuifilaceae bacterium]HOY72754.1 undecaprenyldiphospho-muramoylpe
MEKNQLKVIISGGGTGGHIFPAIAIANAVKELSPEAEILFVGALGRMEMERVPQAGYRIVGLPIIGIRRSLSPQNIMLVFKLIRSLRLSRKIIADFRPDVVVGVGGYASGPILRAAQKRGIPTLIQEQNSFAGITNKMLAAGAHKICVAYDGMERYFPKEKIIKTGNPVRQDIETLKVTREEAFRFFNLSPEQKVLLVLGGSLGAGTINQSLRHKLDAIARHPEVAVIWQTGKFYYEAINQELAGYSGRNIRLFDFINRMDMAFAAADLVISRAGAGTISELCLVGKPAILVPSPNVAEDHQTHNAEALVKRNAAVMVADSDAEPTLVETAFSLISNEEKLRELAQNILTMALPNSATLIAGEVLSLANANSKSL